MTQSASQSIVVNISAYKFVTIDDVEDLHPKIKAECERLALKGTVLLAPEGINLFVAGTREAIDAFVNYLHADQRFVDLAPKESFSDTQPFRRLYIKKRREIITMNRPVIQPEKRRAPAVKAATLKRWLDQGHDDEGRSIVMLDTRNAFEVDYGAFEGCIDYRISKFSEFPAAVEARSAELADKTVVTFCTGGIRCEKAAIVMQAAGVENVYQLDGGILKYFEDVGGAHWRGSCFVFDEREALDPVLTPVKNLPKRS
ncbi:MAG TPA: sulfurtransferase [Rhodocyclaceae bacterium]|nr:sulfurtransferase [Rhodocyclaceae bacterium]